MRKLWLSRKAVVKNQGYPRWTLQITRCGLKEVKMSIQSMLVSAFSKTSLLQVWFSSSFWKVEE